MTGRILMSSPDVGELEEQYLLNAFRSGWIAPLGPDVDAFESEIADRVGVAHAAALSSGTAALHLALLGVGVQHGDTVVTSTMTFAATANAITYTGAKPFFVDCDLATGNMSPELLQRALDQLAKNGTHVAAIVPVDLLGKAVDYTAICRIADAAGIPVVADAAESLGATHRGRAAGSFGAVSIVSFNGNKVMTTSGGGMLLTDDAELASRARYLATQARQPAVHYEHTEVGYNYRLSNLLAALGRAQLTRLDSMIARRRAIRDHYREFFTHVNGVVVFGQESDREDNFWLTSILVDKDTAGFSADQLRAALARDNIESRPLWKPMHLQPVFASAPAVLNGNSGRLFEMGLTLPSGSVLSENEVQRVIDSTEAIRSDVRVSARTNRCPYDWAKRGLDIFGASTIFLVSIPLQAGVAIAVAVKLGRPVLFTQLRPGRDGKIFTLIKFRSMRDVDRAKGLVADGDRLTPFGKILRSTSLDELPSLVNVIKGDMSMVGPRPLLVSYLERYTREQSRRHEVRPGITGLAQVTGRNELKWEERFRLDVEYVDRRSCRLDAQILWRTVTAVFMRSGISAEGHATMHEFSGSSNVEKRS